MGARIGRPSRLLPIKSGAFDPTRYRGTMNCELLALLLPDVCVSPTARARGATDAHRIGGCTHDAMSKNMNASAFSCSVSV
jgi:hypothetical protein